MSCLFSDYIVWLWALILSRLESFITEEELFLSDRTGCKKMFSDNGYLRHTSWYWSCCYHSYQFACVHVLAKVSSTWTLCSYFPFREGCWSERDTASHPHFTNSLVAVLSAFPEGVRSQAFYNNLVVLFLPFFHSSCQLAYLPHEDNVSWSSEQAKLFIIVCNCYKLTSLFSAYVHVFIQSTQKTTHTNVYSLKWTH